MLPPGRDLAPLHSLVRRHFACQNDLVMSGLYGRMVDPPKGSFFLFGVRGVGKSTWARTRLPQAVRFDLLERTRRGSPLVIADSQEKDRAPIDPRRLPEGPENSLKVREKG